MDANRYIGGISFGNTSAYGYNLGTGILHLNNGGVIQTLAGNGNHTDTVSSAIVISGTSAATATFTAGASSATSLLSIGAVTGSATAGNTTTLTLNGTNTGANAISAIISAIIGDGAGGGNLAITKSDAGSWTLSAVNTFTGNITVNGGTLSGTAANAFGASGTTRTITINSGATVNSGFAGMYGGTHYSTTIPTFIVNSGGTLTTTSQSQINNITLNSGTLTSNYAGNSTYKDWNINGTVTSTGNSTISDGLTGANVGITLASGSKTNTNFDVKPTALQKRRFTVLYPKD